jgi:hypothetical protein
MAKARPSTATIFAPPAEPRTPPRKRKRARSPPNIKRAHAAAKRPRARRRLYDSDDGQPGLAFPWGCSTPLPGCSPPLGYSTPPLGRPPPLGYSTPLGFSSPLGLSSPPELPAFSSPRPCLGSGFSSPTGSASALSTLRVSFPISMARAEPYAPLDAARRLDSAEAQLSPLVAGG